MRSPKPAVGRLVRRLCTTLHLKACKSCENCRLDKVTASSNRCCVAKVPFARITTPEAGKFGQPVTNYCIEVDVGTPPGSFLVQLDIGEDDCFLPSHDWSIDVGNFLRHDEGYSSDKSWSCKLTGSNEVIIEYQDCKLIGSFYQDTITLSALSGTIRIEQTFLAARSDTNGLQFKYLPVHGCFGLSPKRQSKSSGTKTLIANISNSLNLGDRMFSMWFSKQTNDKTPGGYLIFGEPDYSLFQGKISWHRSSKKSWTIKIVALSLGSGCLWKPNKPCRARLSSGVNEILGPIECVNLIYQELGAERDPVSGLAFLPQTKDKVPLRLHKFPNIVIQTKKYELIVGPRNYLIEMDSRYLVAIMPICASSKYDWSLGTIVLANQYTVFQPDRRRVGFASRL